MIIEITSAQQNQKSDQAISDDDSPLPLDTRRHHCLPTRTLFFFFSPPLSPSKSLSLFFFFFFFLFQYLKTWSIKKNQRKEKNIQWGCFFPPLSLLLFLLLHSESCISAGCAVQSVHNEIDKTTTTRGARVQNRDGDFSVS